MNIPGFAGDFLRWATVAGETAALLRRNEQLLARRAELLVQSYREFGIVTRLAHDFADHAGDTSQEPSATRTGSRRKR